MYAEFLFFTCEYGAQNRTKRYNGPVIQGSRFNMVFFRFFRKLPDYCHEYIPTISFRKCNFPTFGLFQTF